MTDDNDEADAVAVRLVAGVDVAQDDPGRLIPGARDVGAEPHALELQSTQDERLLRRIDLGRYPGKRGDDLDLPAPGGQLLGNGRPDRRRWRLGPSAGCAGARGRARPRSNAPHSI